MQLPSLLLIVKDISLAIQSKSECKKKVAEVSIITLLYVIQWHELCCWELHNNKYLLREHYVNTYIPLGLSKMRYRIIVALPVMV
jgi:hypothetical protein